MKTSQVIPWAVAIVSVAALAVYKTHADKRLFDLESERNVYQASESAWREKYTFEHSSSASLLSEKDRKISGLQKDMERSAVSKKVTDQLMALKDETIKNLIDDLQAIAATSIHSTSPAQNSDSSSESWHQLKTFSGGATARTEWFSVSGSDWRVKYSLQKSGGEDSLSVITAFAEGDNGFLLLNTDKPAAGIVYGHKSGRYYFDVSAVNFNWELIVEEYR